MAAAYWASDGNKDNADNVDVLTRGRFEHCWERFDFQEFQSEGSFRRALVHSLDAMRDQVVVKPEVDVLGDDYHQRNPYNVYVPPLNGARINELLVAQRLTRSRTF